MPVLGIGRRRRADGLHDLLQRIRPVGRPEPDGLRVEVDVVREVVPVVRHELGRPLRGGLHAPAQRVIRGGLSAECAVFDFGEVALYKLSDQPVLYIYVHTCRREVRERGVPQRKQSDARNYHLADSHSTPSARNGSTGVLCRDSGTSEG